MSLRDRTSMGGAADRFDTTDWTVIVRAGGDDESARREATERLARTYWKPVYCYLRQLGNDNEQAKDLTQGFFVKLLDGPLLGRAAKSRGRFRTLLRTALRNYARDQHRRRSSARRSPSAPLLSLDATDLPEPPCGPPAGDPQQAYDYAWATTLLDAVISDVRTQCLAAGQEDHWRIFQARVLDAQDGGPAELEELCGELGIDDARRASNMAQTVRRRFQRVLRGRVRESVESSDAVEPEIQSLIEILGDVGAAGSA